MSYDTQRNAIQTRFKTQWQASYPTIPIVYDNLRAEKAPDGYVALSILNGASTLRGMGAQRLFRYPGVISVDVFIPAEKGTKLLDQYADTIEGIFRAVSFNGILCRSVDRRDLGKQDNFWRVNVSFPFTRDELH